MKKIIIICFMASLVLTAAASCKPNTKYEEGTIFMPSWKTEEEKLVAEEWKARLERIVQSDKIAEVEYIIGLPHIIEGISSQDILIIDRWKTLLSKFRCSVVTFQMFRGGSDRLTFYEDEESFSLERNTADVFLSEERTRDFSVRIDNYEELKDEFFAIFKDMGVEDYMGRTGAVFEE